MLKRTFRKVPDAAAARRLPAPCLAGESSGNRSTSRPEITFIINVEGPTINDTVDLQIDRLDNVAVASSNNYVFARDDDSAAAAA